MLDVLLIGWVLTWFRIDDLVINAINQIFNTDFTTAVYWLIIFALAIINQIIGKINSDGKDKDKNEDKKSKKKSKKEEKKKIKDYEKQKDSLNINVLRFEYSIKVDWVKEVLSSKFGNDFEKTNELYLFKYDEYYRNFKSIRVVNQNSSIESVACLCKAIIDEPIISDSTVENEKIVLDLISCVDRYSGSLEYNNMAIRQCPKEQLILQCMKDYKEFNSEIFLICAFILNRLHW